MQTLFVKIQDPVCIVSCADKQAATVVAAIDHMIACPGKLDAQRPRHARITPIISTYVKSQDMTSSDCAEEKVERQQTLRMAATPAVRGVPAQQMVRHAAQLTCQFIRLVRHCFAYQTPWHEALPRFKQRLEAYL